MEDSDHLQQGIDFRRSTSLEESAEGFTAMPGIAKTIAKQELDCNDPVLIVQIASAVTIGNRTGKVANVLD